MRRLGGFIIVLATVLFGSPAFAVSEVRGGIGQTGGDADLSGHFSSDGSDAVRGPSGGSGPKQCYATYLNYANQVVSLPVDCDQVPSEIVFASPLALLPPEAPTAATTGAVVRDYIRTLSMPVPRPKMSAATGITGATHSLDLQTQASRTFPVEDTEFGQLRANAKGTFTVNWGDGSTGSYTSTGAAWPNSNIAHSYANTGTYDVVVTARWSLNWSLGGFSGVITGLQTTGTIDDFPVIEAQAVIIH